LNRPGFRPGGNTFVRPTRPGGSSANIGNRIGNRTLIGGNRTNIGGTRITNINRSSNFTNINRGSGFGTFNRGSRFGTFNRGSRFVTSFNRFNRPWWGFHRGWYRGVWSNWPYYPAFWAGLYGASWLAPWAVGTTFVYANPYYIAPANPIPYLDYSEPIPVPTESEIDNTDEDTVNAAMAHFSQAEALFKEGRYEESTAEVDAGLQLLPADRTMHEFRALTLFARGMYDEAAAGIYAVLAGGPGWDWATMQALYDSPETYTAQLRALEAYIRDRPRDAAARLLLAYQYLVIDDRDAALSQLETGVKLKPNDKLSAQLIGALTHVPESAQP
jgi:tetratricopeptide (TPR) repeat protein